jgi:endonuclease YncB( thermonuclease family)
MKNFFEKNKVPLTIIVAAFLIAASICLSRLAGGSPRRTKRPSLINPQSVIDRQPALLQLSKTALLPQHSAKRIDYTEAPNHVGEYACVSGKIDHVYISQKGNTFLNFCPDYKTCPFHAVIFSSDAYKFSNPKQYEGKTVEITGLIRAYKGRAQIILDDLSQIKILSHEPSSIKREAPPIYRIVEVIDGDTIKVDIGGKIETVRLIGMDTPEIASPHNPQDDYFGPEAAQYAKQLMENQLVYLIPDPMQSNRDKYNRLLRYVFLEDGTLVNAKLIEEGYAYNYIYQPFQFMKQFDYLEKQAKEKQLGLWSGKKTKL